MKNIIKNKLLSAIIILALSVTAIFGVLSFKGEVLNANAQTTGNVYYTSPDVSYGTIGEANNREKPYHVVTLLNSKSILKPGDTVKVMAGNYDLSSRITMTVSGSYNNYITIENESSTEQATLQFYKQSFLSLNRGVEIEGNYIHWRDVDVCGAGDNGLYIGGSYNIIEDSEFYNNRDTGLQLGRADGSYTSIEQWPSYNLIKNCTSHNNYDNQTYGENADGFAAKLTIGYGNVFDGCIAYRNSDDGWDLYAKTDSGNIGAVIMYNCIAFENGYLEYDQETNNARFPLYETSFNEKNTKSYDTRDGDGNGFKLGGSVMEGDVVMYNCLSFHNKYHGVTDNSNPGVISLKGITSYDNSRGIDSNGNITAAGCDLGGGNIDVNRQTYSYNNLENILSVKSSKATAVSQDAYRGSVQNSILGTSTTYKIQGSLDADTRVGIWGTKTSTLVDTDVFKALPSNSDKTSFTLTGLKDTDNGEGRVHVKYRNADGSINLGDIFAVKDQSKLLGSVAIGSVFNLTSYDQYDHFELTNDYTSCTSEEEAILKAAKETLTIACNPNAVYQDFWVAKNMKNVTVEWQSSDLSVAEVVEKEKEIKSLSGTKFSYIVVKRDAEQDKQVTLTATIKYGEETTTKTFTLNVKMDEPRIGDIYVLDNNGNKIYAGGSMIIDQYAIAYEPSISVVNGANYSGMQFVAGSQYSDEVTYEYATSRLDNYVKVNEFTPSNAGVWRITHKVVLNLSKETKSFTYYIYTASVTANVQLTQSANISVNLDGYLIQGNLSNVTGYIYAISSDEQLELTGEQLQAMEGVESYTYTSDQISFQFTNDNNSSYYVYYVLANMRNQVTSPVYTGKIDMVEVSNNKDFMKVAGGSAIGSENIATTIYSLTKCLDFDGTNWNVGSNPFTGYLTGNGHKVSNITVSGAGVFYKVEGGTIRDINFDNIIINNGEAQKTGLISTVYGGSFDNIAITRIDVSGGQRTGAFIGQVLEGKVATTISRISVVNPIPTLTEDGDVAETEEKVYMVKAIGTRASSLVGFIQPSSNPQTDLIVYISNCYTSSYTTASNYSVSGIVAEYDDSKGATGDLTFFLEIKNCYTTSVLVETGSSSRMGGMVGYHKGGGTLRVLNCFSRSTAYFAKMKVDVAQKNISGIMGNFAAYGCLVSQCISSMEEYNTDYGVTCYEESFLSGRYGEGALEGLHLDNDVWYYVYDDTGLLKAPYIALINNNCAC